MKKSLLLLPLLAISLIGCSDTDTRKERRIQTYDTGWKEIDLTRSGKFVIYVDGWNCDYTFSIDNYKEISYRYCTYDVHAELTIKSIKNNTTLDTYTDYYCGTNVTYRLYQEN